MTDTHGARLRAEAAGLLRELHDWEIEPGLGGEEFERIEAQYGFRFADDHRAFLAAAPPLVPLYGHRFLPAGRGTSGHPVLSIWGTDMISYGGDLAEYIDHEFAHPGGFPVPEGWDPQATVPFWKDFPG
ncbi:hypothetical protein [Streptomyces sp. Y1]|uniref:SMI1/KNR4 family protein n=1 Tax=Streptomyces sp. Y1 TaxID=3238634 RepID=A0AB39TEC9_9ACTN